MDRLNYFNSYNSKDGSHEDQLTRAYLVLLKHSSHSFFTFFEYCRYKHIATANEKSISILDHIEHSWSIETQKGNPEIDTNYLLSILITDSQVGVGQSNIESSERNARYDGVITFGKSLTMIIENKPRSGNVWFGQLSPSMQNLGDDTIVYSSPAVLEWKEIIKQLNHLLGISTISGNEKILIEDFLSYVDEKFPFLNPYDSFHQCKGSKELVGRRIHNLLKSITLDENSVKYHRGWGYYIETPYRQIQELGLIFNSNEAEWWLELSLYFGDSQRQAISFYSSNPTVTHLNQDEWELNPNFHVSFMTSNLVWFRSDSVYSYLDFWKNNVDLIYQQKRENVPTYIDRLCKQNVINVSPETIDNMQSKFYDTVMSTLNICPGFGLIFTISSAEAEELDRSGKLKTLIAEKIREGLKVIGIDGNDLLRQF
ncbi:MAG: hypothetical protein JWO44_958 [Bacteroidetes bacterium]|nr:hypothetical protein [Bacteroidota bacterium]